MSIAPSNKFLPVYLPRGAEKPLRPKQDGKLDYKTKPLISGLDRRDDEIGQLSKIINEMLNSLYNKIGINEPR